MSDKRRDTTSIYNRTSMQGQYSALMTQGRPHRSKKKDFDILVHRSGGRPNLDLSSSDDLEVRDPINPDDRVLARVLTNASSSVFCDGRTPRHDTDKDVYALASGHRWWHAGERYVRTRAPTAKRIIITDPCAEICFLQ